MCQPRKHQDDGTLLPAWLIVVLAFLLGWIGPWVILNWRTVLLPLVLSGCATYTQPFVTKPGNFACVFVQWTEESKIQNYCAPGAEACGTVAHRPNTMWAPMPEAFDDFWRVYKVGHEFLHSLGATHE